MKDDFLLLILLAFLIGIFIGEYQTCPADKYSIDHGCEVRR